MGRCQCSNFNITALNLKGIHFVHEKQERKECEMQGGGGEYKNMEQYDSKIENTDWGTTSNLNSSTKTCQWDF